MSSIPQILTSEAPVVYKCLTGLLCVNKPASQSMRRLNEHIRWRISQELNKLQVRPLKPFVSIIGDTSKKLKVSVAPSFADHPSVIGPRYDPDEVQISYGKFLGMRTSGVVVFGINDGYKEAVKLRKASLLSTYILKGKLGLCTDTNFEDGKVLVQGCYDFVTRAFIDKVAATMQAQYQRVMFNLCAVGGSSQTAYEMASQGLLRPHDRRSPLIYGIKCVDYSPPEFTLEVQCANETEEYLVDLITTMGEKLKTLAVCVQVKCIRFSLFELNDALLIKHWTLQNLVDNIKENHRKYQKISESLSPMLTNPEKPFDPNGT